MVIGKPCTCLLCHVTSLSSGDSQALQSSVYCWLLYLPGVALTAENLEAAVTASGNKVESYWTSLFASFLEKSEGVEKFCGKPGSGGGGGGGGAPAGVYALS
jgi:hypothetical protein